MDDQLIATLSSVARDGAFRAGRGLSGLMGQEIVIHVPNVRLGTRDDACDSVGGEESLVMGAYLAITGDITGHAMLLFPTRRALQCVDIMCGQRPGTTSEPNELAESAIGELGNIIGSAFINALADHMNLSLHPTPPTVVHDMAVALVDTVYAEVLSQGGDVVMMDAIFEDRAGRAAGLLIVAPDPASLSRLQRVAA